jgi:ParB/RepB/Spo0J family partition protein
MEITRWPLSRFKVRPQARQPEHDVGDLRNLGESLKQRQLSPVGALIDGWLLYGHRRLRAAELAGLSELEVKVYDEPLTESQIKVIHLTENIHRKELEPSERYEALVEFQQLHPKLMLKDLAQMLHLHPSQVTRLLSPSNCISAMQEAFKTGRVGISDCYAASKLSDQQQHELLRMKLDEGVTQLRDKAAALVRKTRKARPKGARPCGCSKITVSLGSGSKVSISKRSLALTDVVEALRGCLEAAEKALTEKLDARAWESVMRSKAKAEVAGV